MPRAKRTASASQFSPPSKRVANDAARHESSHPLGSRHAPVELDSSPEAEASTHTEPAGPINPPAQAEPPLSKEQQRVVDLIVDGQNVFYTGSAGCGKSTILRAFVKELKSLGKVVRICAPTNLAALNVGGFTLWSYAGWIVPDVNKDLDTLRRGAHRKQVWNRMNKTDLLVIDEISMVENNFFTRLNEVLKAARGSSQPFGGVQIVVTGDFCQLAPVKPFQNCFNCGKSLREDDYDDQYHCDNRSCPENVFHDVDKWAFRSSAWQECRFVNVNLTKIFRQSDRKFVEILQSIRRNVDIPEDDAYTLLNHECSTEGAVEIYPHRADVLRINNKCINALPSQPRRFACKDYFNWKPEHKKANPEFKKYNFRNKDGTLKELDQHRYESVLQFKKDMRVVLQQNLDPEAGLVNGSQGVIEDFEAYDERKLPRARKESEERGSDGPILAGSHATYEHHEIRRYAEEHNYQPWPVVKFDDGQTRTIFPNCSSLELGDTTPYSLLSRTQIPLMAGYAITVHKAQGMTMDKVKVNLQKAFDPSQVYVALSRARSLYGLQVTALPKKHFGGQAPEVKEFMDSFS